MNERVDEIEQQRRRRRHFQSEMKTEKKLFKTESRFKSKFKSLKKLPHTTSTNSAVEKARTFFRSLELKRHHDNEHSLSIDQHTTTNNIPSMTLSINNEHRTDDFLLNPITRTTNISISKITKVDKINPTDMIVYRVMHNDQDMNQLPLNYFQQKYKQYMKPSLLFPKQYYNDLLNRSNRTYSTSLGQRNSCLRSSLPTYSSNSRYSTRIYPPLYYSTTSNTRSSHHRLSNSFYDNPLLVYRQMESSFLGPLTSSSSIIRPLPTSPSSSTSTWNQCVDRLNTEYRSTINALEQAKEYLEDVYINPTNSISEYASLVARDISNLSNHETKKSSTVTFCLPAPTTTTTSESFSPTKFKHLIEKSKISTPAVFSKPKLVKPIALNIFSKFEPVVSVDDKPDSIANIIKKFNDLSNSISSTIEKCQMTKKTMDQSTPSKLKDNSDRLLSSAFIVINDEEDDQIKSHRQEEETTYTIETIYKSTNNQDDHLSCDDDQSVVITRENTTAEQFELVYEKQHHDIHTSSSSSPEKMTCEEIKLRSANENTHSNQSSTNCSINNASSSSTPTISLKNTNKFSSQIPKRTTMHTSSVKSSSQFSSPVSKLKSSSSTIIEETTTLIEQTSEITTKEETQLQAPSIPTNQAVINDQKTNRSPDRIDSTPSIRKNYVKAMVRQLNTTASPPSTISSSMTSKRACRRACLQPTTFTNKNAV